MKLIGHAFISGRVDFLQDLNPRAFKLVEKNKNENRRDRITVDPRQTEITLEPALVNDGEVPAWMEGLERVLNSADKIYLNFKNGALRLRRAYHDLDEARRFVTLANQEEFDAFAKNHWQMIRYFYAVRRANGFCYDFNTLITHKKGTKVDNDPLKLNLRMDLNHPSGRPQIVIDSSGVNTPVEIIEWRKEVEEGENGRFELDRHLCVSVKNVVHPFTVLHEKRSEFKNYSYSFAGEKMDKLLERTIKARLKEKMANKEVK